MIFRMKELRYLIFLILYSCTTMYDLYWDCDHNNDMDACFNYGFFLEEEKRTKEAFSFYKMACDGNHGGGCNNAGLLAKGLAKSDNVDIGYSELYRRSCELGEMMGCSNLGIVYYYEYGHLEKATDSFIKSCSGEYIDGCLEFREVLKKECTSNNKTGCSGLKMVENKIKDIYNKKCDNEELGACFKVRNIYKQECDNDDNKGCFYFESMERKISSIKQIKHQREAEKRGREERNRQRAAKSFGRSLKGLSKSLFPEQQ